MALFFFPEYRSVCQWDWWDLSISCLGFFSKHHSKPQLSPDRLSWLQPALEGPCCGLVLLVMVKWGQTAWLSAGLRQSCSWGTEARQQQSALGLCYGHAASSLPNELGAAMLSTVIKIYSVLAWRRDCIFACKRSQRSRVDLNSSSR